MNLLEIFTVELLRATTKAADLATLAVELFEKGALDVALFIVVPGGRSGSEADAATAVCRPDGARKVLDKLVFIAVRVVPFVPKSQAFVLSITMDSAHLGAFSTIATCRCGIEGD